MAMYICIYRCIENYSNIAKSDVKLELANCMKQVRASRDCDVDAQKITTAGSVAVLSCSKVITGEC